MKRKRNDESLIPQHEEHNDPEVSQNEKKKKKKKSKKANDLRFEALDEAAGAGSRRKDRKKQ